MDFLYTIVLFSLLAVVNPSPVTGVFPDQDKTDLFTLYDKFTLLEEKYNILFHTAVAKEDFYYKNRVNKTVLMDRTVSTKVVQTKMTYSLFNGTYADDIEGFLNQMATDYGHLEGVVDDMRKQLIILYQ